MTKPKSENVITGTIAELSNPDTGILINGQPVGQPELSVLSRLGMLKEVGQVERPAGQRGPAAKIWEVRTKNNFAVARK